MAISSKIILQKFKKLLTEEQINNGCTFVDPQKTIIIECPQSSEQSLINCKSSIFELSNNFIIENDENIDFKRNFKKKHSFQLKDKNYKCSNFKNDACNSVNTIDSCDKSEIYMANISDTHHFKNLQFNSSNMNHFERLDNQNSDQDLSNEQIHMSWDELMQEAKMYGIGLVCPKLNISNSNKDKQKNKNFNFLSNKKKKKLAMNHDKNTKIVANTDLKLETQECISIAYNDDSYNAKHSTNLNSNDETTTPELNDVDDVFMTNFRKLKHQGWYWGPIGWEEAEEILKDKCNGCFLVRDSSNERYILSISFRAENCTHHTRIEHFKGMFSFSSQPRSLAATTIVEFIDSAIQNSSDGRFLYFLRPQAPGHPPAPVRLLYPISRFNSVSSLQHLCRFIIVNVIRRDHINELPIPQRIKTYLNQTQYYVEDIC